MLYGFAPASVTGANIHTIAWKNSARLFNRPLNEKITFSFSAGVSLNYYMTRNTFLILPGEYPERYYFQNALHAAPYLSFDLMQEREKNNWFNRLGAYLELGTLDYYLWKFLESGSVGFSDIWNIAIGVNISLRKQGFNKPLPGR
jgi:hypothetical protein